MLSRTIYSLDKHPNTYVIEQRFYFWSLFYFRAYLLIKGDIYDAPWPGALQAEARETHNQDCDHIDYGYRFHNCCLFAGSICFLLRDTVFPPELHFAEISFKVLWAHVMKNTNSGSLEYGWKRLGRIAVSVSTAKLPFWVIDVRMQSKLFANFHVWAVLIWHQMSRFT